MAARKADQRTGKETTPVDDASRLRGASLTITLSTGVPAERNALRCLRDLVASEGYDYKALVKHLFLEGVRAYGATLGGTGEAYHPPEPLTSPTPRKAVGSLAAPARQRATAKPEVGAEDVGVPNLATPPPATNIPRPNFAGLMGESI